MPLRSFGLNQTVLSHTEVDVNIGVALILMYRSTSLSMKVLSVTCTSIKYICIEPHNDSMFRRDVERDEM
jgi:hypothetical protein